MTRWLLLSVWATGSVAACIPVGERILGADIGRAVPAFADIPGETVIDFAPPPGARRTYGPAELERLARRFGIRAEPGEEACFVRFAEPLTSERVQAALQAALPGESFELLEFSHQPAPPGELHFSPPAGSGSTWVWQGRISRAGQADFPVWARVRLRASGKRVVAAQPLRAGQPIARAQLGEEAMDVPPGAADLSQIVGRAPRRPIAAGLPILAAWLEDPADVLAGQPVTVEVRCGQALLRLEGRAQAPGKMGQVIPVRNPATGKIFRAMVAGRARVVLRTGPPDSPDAGANP